ncbi:MAG TPA: hypothetical protein VFW03_26560 [Gemmatimonadaceae bacterium]|nr:hypothetical protein [Gemmatimonadaceae bacterium]
MAQTLADRLKKTVYRGRAIAGGKGFRTHTVSLLDRSWTGQHTGEGSGIEQSTPITEANNQPPKVRWLKQDEIALANLAGGSVEIGPITPRNDAGTVGTDPALFTDVSDANTGKERYLLIKGPMHPTGAVYAIKSFRNEKALRIMLIASPVAPEYR